MATDKTKIMIFDSGSKEINLKPFTLAGKDIEFTTQTKFLGVTLTSKLNWSLHFTNIISKVQVALNLMKIISFQSWGENIASLRTIALALVRSRLTYAQEAYFSAPKQALKKLQTIDCKSLKIALRVGYLFTQTT